MTSIQQAALWLGEGKRVGRSSWLKTFWIQQPNYFIESHTGVGYEGRLNILIAVDFLADDWMIFDE